MAMEHTSDRDVAYWASSRLGGEWSSLDSFGPRLTKEVLESLISQFSRLDPMVRVRLLLSTLFMPQSQLQDLRPTLRKLTEAAEAEDDEWVRVFGVAVSKFDGRLDIDAVKQEFPLVETTLRQLQGEMQKTSGEPGFRPLEEIYLSHRLQRMRGLDPGKEPPAHHHFALREGAGLSIMQMIDEQEHHPRTAGHAYAAGAPSGRGHEDATPIPETDMFMDTNPVKENVTIAGLGTVGRVDSRRTGGRMKQLDVDEAIAAENLSRQMSDAGNLSAKTPRARCHSSQTGDDPFAGGVMDTSDHGVVKNPFLSGLNFEPAAGNASIHLPQGKRGREWESVMDAEPGQVHAPLLKDTLAELGADGAQPEVDGKLDYMRQTDASGGVNYF